MRFTLNLRLGEAFAEIRGHGSPRRWSLAKKNLLEGLKENLIPLTSEASNGGTIEFTICSAAFDQGIAAPASGLAFLVSEGFENLLNPVALKTLTGTENVFSVSERISIRGEITTPLALSELEASLTKLKTLQITTVAIAFLHAKEFSQHEKQAAAFFRENGFQVIASCEIVNEPNSRGINEADLFLAVLIRGNKLALLKEAGNQVQTALEDEKGKWQILPYFQNEGPIGADPIPPDRMPALCLELEKFSLKFADGSEKLLDLQPAHGIVIGPLNAPEFEALPRRFLPGPVLLGRSYQPTLLDILYVQGHLDSFESIVPPPTTATRTKTRLLDTFFTMAKNIASEVRIENKQIITALELLIADKIAGDLLAVAMPEKNFIVTNFMGKNFTIIVQGSLAPALIAGLKKRLPQLTFQLEKL